MQSNSAYLTLEQRRDAIVSDWHSFTQPKTNDHHYISQTIRHSWQRSSAQLPIKKASIAPLSDQYETKYQWHESIIHQAAKRELGKLMDMAHEGDLVAAISDPSGKLLWTTASRRMQQCAEDVNFVAGGSWSEQAVGTNAVGLSAVLRQPVTVFSAEHYMSYVHDWVCYAAPIIHPQTQALVGVLDLSTTWDRHTPLGQGAVRDLAGSIASRLPAEAPKAELELYLLGQPRVVFRGETLHLSQRQLEILALLALNPSGFNLNSFHAALYGDANVSTSTLKSELSTLRTSLGGAIGSRPYRLLVSVWSDCGALLELIKNKHIARALALYRGTLLADSSSPELEQWRYCIEAMMSKLLSHCDDADMLINQCSLNAGELIRERLMELAN